MNMFDPIGEGIGRGASLALMLKRARWEQEEYEKSKQQRALEDQVRGIQMRQVLQEIARPVDEAGTVEDTLPFQDQTGIELPLPFRRKAAGDRAVEYGGRRYELRTPEEQQTRKRRAHSKDLYEDAFQKGSAAAKIRERMLADSGVDVPMPHDYGDLQVPFGRSTIALPVEDRNTVRVLPSEADDMGRLIQATREKRRDGRATMRGPQARTLRFAKIVKDDQGNQVQVNVYSDGTQEERPLTAKGSTKNEPRQRGTGAAPRGSQPTYQQRMAGLAEKALQGVNTPNATELERIDFALKNVADPRFYKDDDIGRNREMVAIQLKEMRRKAAAGAKKGGGLSAQAYGGASGSAAAAPGAQTNQGAQQPTWQKGQRAKNPKTGQTIEWDGAQWVPVR